MDEKSSEYDYLLHKLQQHQTLLDNIRDDTRNLHRRMDEQNAALNSFQQKIGCIYYFVLAFTILILLNLLLNGLGLFGIIL